MNHSAKRTDLLKLILTILTGVSLAFFILTSSVMLTLSMKWTYRLSRDDIIQVEHQLDEATIVHNYDTLIDYMFAGPDTRLTFRELPMSPEGEFHFWEVKVIFQNFFRAMLISGFITLLISAVLIRERDLRFLNLGSILVFLVPALLAIPVALNFDRAFVMFHEIAFSNDYWIFDPVRDPIIRYLPQSLFLKNTLIILVIIIFWIFLIQGLKKRLKARTRNVKT